MQHVLIATNEIAEWMCMKEPSTENMIAFTYMDDVHYDKK